MNDELWRWLVPLIASLLSGVVVWVAARRTREATDTGLELENAGKALGLYKQTIDIAQGQQDRLTDALREIDAMRIERVEDRRQLAECVEARSKAERRELLREQQAKIDKASQDIVTASLRREIAELNLRIVSIHGETSQPVQALAAGEDGE